MLIVIVMLLLGFLFPPASLNGRVSNNALFNLLTNLFLKKIVGALSVFVVFIFVFVCCIALHLKGCVVSSLFSPFICLHAFSVLSGNMADHCKNNKSSLKIGVVLGL